MEALGNILLVMSIVFCMSTPLTLALSLTASTDEESDSFFASFLFSLLCLVVTFGGGIWAMSTVY